MEIELRHLRAFAAVAEERHFGRAAERLKVAQPSLSQQIRRIERELGTELFNRRSHPIELTRAGATFLDDAVRILNLSGRAVRSARGAARGELGMLSIGAGPWSCTGILPSLLHAFGARFPGVSLDLWVRRGPDFSQGLIAGWLDVGVGSPVPLEGLRIEPLLVQSVVAVVPEDHRLADRTTVSVAELVREPFLSIARDFAPYFGHLQDTLLSSRGLTPAVICQVPDPHVQLALVASGVGVGIHLASSSGFRHLGVSFVALEEESPRTELSLAWRHDDDREVIHNFLETTREAARPFKSP